MEPNVWYQYTHKRLIEALNYHGRDKYDILIRHPAYGYTGAHVDFNRVPRIDFGSRENRLIFEWYLKNEEAYYPEMTIIIRVKGLLI